MSFKKGVRQKNLKLILLDPGNPVVYIDLQIGEEHVGRVFIELYKHAVPSTAENFRALCTGERGLTEEGLRLHYKGSNFHKLMPHFMYQGGDIVNFNGSAGYSVYGPNFELENFTMPHDAPGTLSMVNILDTYCNSQFIITSTDCPHLNGRSVAFGRVIKGFSCVQEDHPAGSMPNFPILQMGEVKTLNDVPQVPCLIQECGELSPEEYQGNFWNGAVKELPHGPQDLELLAGQVTTNDLIDIINVIITSAKQHFRSGAFVDSERTFRKAIRYIDWVEAEMPKLKLNEPTNGLVTTLDRDRNLTKLNLSATALQLGDAKRCLHYCDIVLANDGSNVKALYRKGKALHMLKDYEAALATQKRALALRPNDTLISSEIRELHRKRASYLAEEKKVFGKMFDFNK